LGISENTYYRWRKEYGGLRVDQARRLKELERENGRLKRLLAETMLDNTILSDNGPEFTSRADRCEDAVHRTGLAVGERLRGELQRQATRRAAERGDLLHAQGGAEPGARVATRIQPGAAT